MEKIKLCGGAIIMESYKGKPVFFSLVALVERLEITVDSHCLSPTSH